MDELPGSVLFACTVNQIRSPMAEAMLKFVHGRRVFVQSAGVRPGDTVDGFAVAVMDEMGLDISTHIPRSFDALDDDFFDLVISLSPEAQHRAVELTRHSHCEIEFWPTMDPSLAQGTREQRLEVYRDLRDELYRRITERFRPQQAPRV
ncbi:MAG: low molecular weight phosphatase family protein [Geminicoccaceae bacterium]|nr:low molecular weight phosphatase family protein [Geminicoccaceae bacterium]